jgi:hypothetical protein
MRREQLARERRKSMIIVVVAVSSAPARDRRACLPT